MKLVKPKRSRRRWFEAVFTFPTQDTVGDGRFLPRCRHLANWFWPIRFIIWKRRHSQNRKYMVALPSDKNRATAIGNMYTEHFGEVWTCGF